MKDRVLQVRQIERDDPFDPSTDKVEARPYDNELVPPVLAAVTSGIDVAAYEGSWPWLPKFSELTSVKTTRAATFEVNRHLTRTTDAGLSYQGYLEVPTDGVWTFYANSDAGMHLRIHESQVIDDDFNHDGSEASGTIRLAAGLHPFTLFYRTDDDAPRLSLRWSGPATAKQDVPATSLFRIHVPDA